MLRKLRSDFIFHLTVFNFAPQLSPGSHAGGRVRFPEEASDSWSRQSNLSLFHKWIFILPSAPPSVRGSGCNHNYAHPQVLEGMRLLQSNWQADASARQAFLASQGPFFPPASAIFSVPKKPRPISRNHARSQIPLIKS